MKKSFPAKNFVGKVIGTENSLAPNRFIVIDENNKMHKPREVKMFDGVFDYRDAEDAFLSAGRNLGPMHPNTPVTPRDPPLGGSEHAWGGPGGCWEFAKGCP